MFNEMKHIFFEDGRFLRTRAIDCSSEGLCKGVGKNSWLTFTSGEMTLPVDLEIKAQVIFSPEKRGKM